MEFGLFYFVAFSLYGSHSRPTSIDWGVFVSTTWGIGDGFSESRILGCVPYN
jgi:hypothetical protein